MSVNVTDNNESSQYDRLPPVTSCNIRQKIKAVELPIDVLKDVKHKRMCVSRKQLMLYPVERSPEPISAHPLILSWTPEQVHFDLFEKPVEAKLSVWNRSTRPIQIQCCALWSDNARLGASWRCYPLTRFWIPPGLNANIFICAKPYATSSIPSSTSSLQIAGTHLRDHVTGYFMVPITTRFLKYVQPPLSEDE